MTEATAARPPSSANKKHQVYEVLKDRIVRNELRPGEYLNELAICRDLEVSKTPVREALQKLEHDRLVVIIPSKGSFVSSISVDRIRETFEIREILECAAARRAAALETRERFKTILENHESYDIGNPAEIRQRLLSGYQIHTLIIEAAQNSFLTDYYRTILSNIVQIRVFFLNRFGMKRLQETVQEHKRFLRAIVDGDPAGAEAAMREHLQRSHLNINELMLGSRVGT
jgi:DNA-binding GntR family transcriptional regulator